MITTGRSLTIKDGDMGLAMLTGDKRMETRKRKLAKGWYNLHLGKQAKTNAAGSLIGMIHVGRIVDCNLLEDTWAKPEFGQFASVIDKSVEFATPIGPISGGQGVWYIKDQEVMRRLEEQLQGADCRNFGEYRADLPDLSAPEKKTIYKPWTKAKQNKNTRQCRKKKRADCQWRCQMTAECKNGHAPGNANGILQACLPTSLHPCQRLTETSPCQQKGAERVRRVWVQRNVAQARFWPSVTSS